MQQFARDGNSLDLNIQSRWDAGLVAEMRVGSDEALNGWRVAFEVDGGEIQNIWNARIVSQDGNRYVVESMDYNAVLSAGASTKFGMRLTGGDIEFDPTSFQVNGAPVGDRVPQPSAPVLSVSAPAVSEEDGSATATVSLSEASDEDITVTYETVDGTAAAGADYVAAQGTLVIPAGETSAEIAVDLLDDNSAEAAESFDLVLTSAQGATLGTDTATIEIADTDAGPAPGPDESSGVTVSNPEVAEGTRGAAPTPTPAQPAPNPAPAEGGLLPDGPLSTSGNQIVDASGNAVQIRAVNWFGAENPLFAPHGLWARDLEAMMDQMVDEGFNAIRLPFSVEGVLRNPLVSGVEANADLAGLTSLEVMDRVVGHAEEIGLKIILDNHRASAGDGTNENGLWFNDEFSQDDWIEAWTTLTARYGDSKAVIGADLANEPHNGTWGGGGPNDWAAAAEQAGNAILENAPDWLVIVEGVANYQDQSYWWGGNLQGVRDRPVELTASDKLVYSPHDYPDSVAPQPWFRDGSDLHEVFRENWGYIHEEGIAPVFLGEFGSRLETPIDRRWAEAITSYLEGDFDGDGDNDLAEGTFGPSFAWWSWNPNSGDTGGILEDDWLTVRSEARALLSDLLDDGPATGGEVADPVVVPEVPAETPPGEPAFAEFRVTLDEPATEEKILSYNTQNGSAEAREDYIAQTGVLTFAVGEQSKIVRIPIVSDDVAENDEDFHLIVHDGPDIFSSADPLGMGTATIQDDDGTPPPPPDPIMPPEPVIDFDDGSEALDAKIVVVNFWEAGGQLELQITNNSDTDIEGWEIAFDLEHDITNLWNAVLGDGQEGRDVTLSDAAYNSVIASGETVSAGFTVGNSNTPLTEEGLNSDADFTFI